MERFLVGLAVVLVLSAAGPAEAATTWEYNSATGHWYGLTGRHSSWNEAESQAQAAGGHLVTINDATENAWLTTTFRDAYVRDHQTPWQNIAWIGYHNSSGWKWSSGESSTYTSLYQLWGSYSGAYTYLHLANHGDLAGRGEWNHNSLHNNTYGYQPLGIIELDSNPVPADFNGDGNVDIIDVNLLTAEADLPLGLMVPPADAKFDLNLDKIIATADLDQWLADAATFNGLASPYLRGDANLDGDVDVWDLDGTGDAQLLSENLGMETGAVWGDGDFNGDGDVDVWAMDGSGDAQLLSENLGSSLDVGTNAVPEPSTLALLAMGVFGLLAYGWRRNIR